MAKMTGKIDAWINIGVNEDAVKKQISTILKDTEEIVNKNVITYKFKVDEKGALQLKEKLAELNEISEGGLVFGFDKKAWNAMLSTLDADGQAAAEKLRGIFENAFKGLDFFKGFVDSADYTTAGVSEAVKKIQNQIAALKKELKDLAVKDFAESLSLFDADNTKANAKKLLATLQIVKEYIKDFDEAQLSFADKTTGAIHQITNASVGKFTRSAIEELLGYAGGKYDNLGKNDKNAIQKIVDAFNTKNSGIFNQIAQLEKKLTNAHGSGGAGTAENPDEIHITPANLEEFHRKIEEYHGSKNPVKIHITPANLDDFHNKISAYSQANPVKTIIQPTIPDGFQLNIANANITGGNIGNNINAGDNPVVNVGHSIGQIVKDIAEAEQLMERVGDSYRLERSLIFNTKTGYVGNTYAHGQKDKVSGRLVDQQIDRSIDQVNAYLHTHPYAKSDITSAVPSTADMEFYAEYLKKGITQQFVATMREVLHLDLEGVDSADMAQMAKKYKTAHNKIRKNFNAYSDTTDYAAEAFTVREDITKARIKNSLSGNDFGTGDIDTFVNHIYQTLSGAFANAAKNFSGKDLDLDTIFNQDLLEQLLPNASSTDQHRLNSALQSATKFTLRSNDVHNNVLFRKELEGVKEIFEKHGYSSSDRIKTYTIDEFEKAFSTNAPVMQHGVANGNQQIGVTLQGDVTKLFTDIQAHADSNPVRIKISPNDLTGFVTAIKNHLIANPIDVTVNPKLPKDFTLDIKANITGLDFDEKKSTGIDNSVLQDKINRLAELQKIIDAGDLTLKQHDSPYPGMRNGFNMDQTDDAGFVKQSAVKEQIQQYRQLLKDGAEAQQLAQQARKVAEYVVNSNYFYGDDIDKHFSQQDVSSGLAGQVKQMIEAARAARNAQSEYNSLQRELDAMQQTPAKNAGGQYTIPVQFSPTIDELRGQIASLGEKTIDLKVNPLLPKDLKLEVQANIAGLGAGTGENVQKQLALDPEIKKLESYLGDVDRQLDSILSKKDVVLRGQSDASKLATWGQDGRLQWGSRGALITKNDIRENMVSLNRIKTVIKDYNNAVSSENVDANNIEFIKDRLVSLTSTYKDLDAAALAFGTKNVELWNEIRQRVEAARASQDAAKDIWSELGVISSRSAQVGLSSMTYSQGEGLTKSLFTGGKEAGYTYLKDALGIDASAIQQQVAAAKQELEKQTQTQSASGGLVIPVTLSPTIEELKGQIAKLGEVPITLAPTLNLGDAESKIKGLSNIAVDINLTQVNPTRLAAITAIQTPINQLLESIDNIATKFHAASNIIHTSANAQVTSINKIVTVVQNLATEMDKIGVTSAKELTQVLPTEIENTIKLAEKMKAEVAAELESLKKQQAEFNKQQEAFNQQQQKIADAKLQKKNDALRQQFIEAARKSEDFDLNESSLRYYKEEGLWKFNVVLDEMGDKALVAKYEIEDLGKAITKAGNLSWTNLDKAYIGEDEIKNPKQVDPVVARRKKALEALKGVEGFDESSFKVDANGVITFTRTIEQAGEATRVLKYEVQDLNTLLTGKNTIRTNFFKKNQGVDIANRAEIESTLQELEQAIQARRLIDETYSIHKDDGSTRSESALAKEMAIRERLAELIAKTNLDLIEQGAIQERITAATTGELPFADIGKGKQKEIDKAKAAYKEVLMGLDDKNILDSQFINNDGNITTIKTELVKVKAEAKEAFDALEKGAFETGDDLESVLVKLRELTKALGILDSNSNKQNYTDGKKQWNYVDSVAYKDPNIKNATTKMEMAKQMLLDAGASYVDIIDQFDTANNTVKANIRTGSRVEATTLFFQDYIDATGRACVAVRKLQGVESEYISTGQKWLAGLKTKISHLTQYITGMSLVMRALNQARQGFAFVKELNTAMTTIHQTMDITTEGLDELSRKSIKAAKDLGAVATQMIDSVNIYAAYGETVDSIISQATPTVMLANAAQSSATDASNQIQAVVQQYEELAGQETRIVNSYEKIAANVQIDFTKGISTISEGVQTAGSVMREAGVDFELYAASLAKVAEKTRLEGSQIGNAMKTIAARISRSKVGDEEATAAERSNTAKAYSSIGINVYNDDGSYRGLANILDELSVKWDTLTDAQKNYIAEQSAGVRNINIFNTMLDTWGEAQDLALSALEDTGYYMEVQDKWMDSMQAKLNSLQASWQEFWYNLIDTGVVNLGVDLLTTLVNALDLVVSGFQKVGSVFGELGGQIGGLAGAAGTVFALASAWTSFNKQISQTNEKGVVVTKRGGLASIGADLKELGKEAKGTWEIFSEGMKNGHNGSKGLLGGIKAVWDASSKLSKTLMGLGAATAVIWAVSAAFDYFVDSSKETAENVKKFTEEYNKAQSSLKSNRQTIDEIGYEYEQLSKGVDEFGNNLSLTSSEYERYHEICNQIADMYPNIVRSYDEQGNAVLDLTGKVKELNKEYEKQRLYAAQANVDNLDDYATDFANKTGNRSGWTAFKDFLGNLGEAKVGGRLTPKDAVDILQKVSEMSYEQFNQYLLELGQSTNPSDMEEYSYLTSKEVIGNSIFEGIPQLTTEEFKALRSTLSTLTSTYISEINSSNVQLKSAMQSLLTTMQLDESLGFSHVDDSVFKQLSNFIGSMTSDQISTITDGADDIEMALREYVHTLTEKFSNNPRVKKALTNIWSIDKNSNIDEIIKILEEDLEIVSVALGKEQAELKVQLGLEDEEELIVKYNKTVESIASKIQAENKTAMDAIYEESQALGGNVDVYNRPKIDANKMRMSGWVDVPDGSTSTYYSSAYSNEDGTKTVVVTPILPNGDVLSPDELQDYANQILDGCEVDADVLLGTFEGKDSIRQAGKFADNLHEASESYDLIESSLERVRQFIKNNNIHTTDQLTLLEQCYNTTGSWSEAMRKFSLTNVDIDVNDEALENLKANLEVVATDIKNIDDAIQASHSSMGLTAEQVENIVSAFSDLEDFDYDKLFESSAEGIRLNVQELDKLNGVYENMQREQYDKALVGLQNQYSDLCVAINDASTATERNKLINKRDDLLKQIEQAQELKSRYEGLTNAVSKYLRAKERGEEGDTYLDIQGDIEEIEKLYKNGLVGTNQFKAAVQMMTNKDMSGASVAEYLDVYQSKWKQFKSWFTEDASGLQEFLEDLQAKGFASLNKSTGEWSVDGRIEEMSEKLGTSQAVIQEIFKRLNDFGFDIDFREETDHLKALREAAEDAKKALGDNKEYKLNLKVADPNAIQEQIDKGKELLANLDENSDEYKRLSSQVKYLQALAGKTADMLNFDLNYEDNKAELDAVAAKLQTMNEYSDLYINLETNDLDNIDSQIKNIKGALDTFRDKDTGKIDFSITGATELSDILIALINKKNQLTNTSVILNLDAHNFNEDQGKVVQGLQDLQGYLDEMAKLDVMAELDIDVTEDKAKVQGAIDKLLADLTDDADGKELLFNLGFNFNTDGSVIQSDLQNVLNGIDAQKLINVGFELSEEDKAALGYVEADVVKEVDADTTKADQKIEAFRIKASKPIELKFNPDGLDPIKNKYDSLKNKTITITTKHETDGGGGADVNGNAHANGNARPTLLQRGLAFAQGTWGAAKNAASLVGELGQELVVRGNRWFTVGDNGAEFTDIRKGDIVFNHKQTEEIFKNGYVTSNGGRGNMANASGNAYLEGNAYASGTYTTDGRLPGSNIFYNDALTFASGSGKDKFKETFDWIEVMIDRLERKIQKLDIVANSSYKNFSNRNKALTEEFAEITNEIQLQEDAYKVYMAKANSIKIPKKYKELIASGKLNIEEITDEKLAEKIKEYQEWYEKALDCKDAVEELKEQLGEIAKAQFDNIAAEFDYLLDKIEDTSSAIEKALDIVEAKGQFASQRYFEELMKAEQENIAMLQQQRAALKAAMEEAMATGMIEEGSEAYYEMLQQIRDVEAALQDANLSLIEIKNQMWEMDWSIFEKAQEYISNLTDEANFLIDLLSFNEAEIFDKETGRLTDKGMAAGGLHALNYNVYMAQAEEYKKKMLEIEAELAKDPTNTILLDKKQEYLKAQQEAIQNANSEKMAIRDLIEQSYQKMLEVLQELIDKRKEALQAERDLYEYEKNVAEKTKQIAAYQKQLAALSGDDSEESKSKRQQLEKALEDAQTDLEETEYDKWLSDQEKLMDDMYSQYEEFLNAKLEDIDKRLEEMIKYANDNADEISKTIETASGGVGYQITDGMKGIWNSSDSGIGKILSTFKDDFSSVLTTTNEFIKKIYKLINKNVENADEDYEDNVDPPAPEPDPPAPDPEPDPEPEPDPDPEPDPKDPGHFFVKKKDSYPKDKLNVNTSIIDRLKYHDINPGWSYLGKYYEGMGLGKASQYKGTAKQNTAMIKWMRKNGYSTGGTIGKLINGSGEDGFVLAKEGEHILNTEQLAIASAMVDKLLNLAKLPNTSAINGVNYTDNSEKNITMNFNLPNVSNGQDFVDFLKTKKAQNIIQSYTIDEALGKNSLNKFKHK